jgi:hypothetical protein
VFFGHPIAAGFEASVGVLCGLLLLVACSARMLPREN